MARPGVTYLDVSNAAQKLVAAGQRPTINTIRIALGTGSNSTLGAHLRNWKEAQDQMQQVATTESRHAAYVRLVRGSLPVHAASKEWTTHNYVPGKGAHLHNYEGNDQLKNLV